MHIDFFFFFLSSVYIYLVLTFDVFNIKILITFDVFNTKILIIYFFRSIFLRKIHELLKAKHLRFKVFNF